MSWCFSLELDKIAAVSGEDTKKPFQIEILTAATWADPAPLAGF
jgi:hypothetical protein